MTSCNAFEVLSARFLTDHVARKSVDRFDPRIGILVKRSRSSHLPRGVYLRAVYTRLRGHWLRPRSRVTRCSGNNNNTVYFAERIRRDTKNVIHHYAVIVCRIVRVLRETRTIHASVNTHDFVNTRA